MSKELPDRDSIIASLLFHLWVEAPRYKEIDNDGNPTAVISKDNIDGTQGYDVVMTETAEGDVRITLKK